MSAYTRMKVHGGTFFFTVNLFDRRERLLIQKIEALRDAMNETRRALPFSTHAIVVLPDHLHCIWSLPCGDADFSERWRRIKSAFSRRITGSEPVSRSRDARRERGVWQRRFWEHLIRDDADFVAHLDYIHYNPVEHGHVGRVSQWPYSSFHRHVRDGFYPEDWAADREEPGDFGEARQRL